MTKTYVVTGLTIYDTVETLYAGTSVDKSMSINIDLPYTKMNIEIWVEGQMIKSYEKTDIYAWDVKYDRIHELEDEDYDLRIKLNAIKEELSTLRALIGSDK